MGLDVESAAGGCCGLAGSWGFEKGKWQISMDCGEQGLFPAVRDADPYTVIVANGFSCKTQLEHAPTIKRHALHLGQVLAMARKGGVSETPKPATAWRVARAGVPVAGAALCGALAAFGGRRRTAAR